MVALGPTLDGFDSGVSEYLETAETHFRRRQYRDAREYYVIAVERAIGERLIAPLCDFVTRLQGGRIEMPYVKREKDGLPRAAELAKWGLYDWAETLSRVPQLRRQSPSAEADFARFLRVTYGWNRQPDLTALVSALKEVQSLRGGVAHARHAMSRREDSIEACRRLRAIALGDGCDSVLTTISQVLRPIA